MGITDANPSLGVTGSGRLRALSEPEGVTALAASGFASKSSSGNGLEDVRKRSRPSSRCAAGSAVGITVGISETDTLGRRMAAYDARVTRAFDELEGWRR